MKLISRLYLILAISGLIGPWYFNLLFFQEHSLEDFINLNQANDATRSINLDLFIATIAGSLFMLYEGLRLKIKHAWFYVAIAFLVVFSFALPLFLFVREGKFEHNNRL